MRLVACGIGVQVVGQVVGVLGTEQGEPVGVVQCRVPCLTALLHHIGDDLPDAHQGQAAAS